MTISERNAVSISAETLQNFAASLLRAGGFTLDESEITARSLVLSNLMGHDSHGVVHAPDYVRYLERGDVVAGVDLVVRQETMSSCIADGQLGLGQVQMPRLLDLLLDKAAHTGCVSGAIGNCGHIGRLGEWVETIAAHGMAGLVTCNDNGVRRVVAPPGGKMACTSTNPIAFGIPLPDGQSFAFDMSTSSVAMGKMRLAYLSGEPCAPGLIQDAEGHPTTNPAVLFENAAETPLPGEKRTGAILPMGGYKGFGLSMMVDCLVAGLSGGFTPPAPAGTIAVSNATVIIWNPIHYAGLAHMQEQAGKYIDFVRNSAPIDPTKPVRIPGDRAISEKLCRTRNGIPFSNGAVASLVRAAQKYGIVTPQELTRSTV